MTRATIRSSDPGISSGTSGATRGGESFAETARASVSEAAEAVSERSMEAAAAVQDISQQAYDTARRFVREQPVMAIAGAVVAGLAIGAMWKVSQRRNTFARQIQRYGEPYLRPYLRSMSNYWR